LKRTTSFGADSDSFEEARAQNEVDAPAECVRRLRVELDGVVASAPAEADEKPRPAGDDHVGVPLFLRRLHDGLGSVHQEQAETGKSEDRDDRDEDHDIDEVDVATVARRHFGPPRTFVFKVRFPMP